MKLRAYQQEAVNSVWDYLRGHEDNPCVVSPTGSGKGILVSQLCKDAVTNWNGRVMVVTHVKELIEQNTQKLTALSPNINFGIYSAGLKRRDVVGDVIMAGVQSVYKRACEFDSFDLVVIDECFPAGTMIDTPHGQKPIEKIMPGDEVNCACGPAPVMATSVRQTTNLVKLEFDDGTFLTCTPNHPIFTEKGWVRAEALEFGAYIFGSEALRVLRERNAAVDTEATGWKNQHLSGESLEQAAILLAILRKEASEPNEFGVGSQSCESQTPQTATSSHSSGRQRSVTPSGSVGPAARLGSGLGSGVGCSDEKGTLFGLSIPLQNRHRECRGTHSNRVGWNESHIAQEAGTGYSQKPIPGTKRLARVSHFQPKGDGLVFNLHVNRHPSYFADGVLVHNCHLISPSGDGMYRQFLKDMKVINPNVRVIGLTATPYRMTTGPICTPDGYLNSICYEAGIRELIRDGYLCPLVSKGGKQKVDLSDVHLRGGEFVNKELQTVMNDDKLVYAACDEIVKYTKDRKSCLIFCTGIAHAEHVAKVMEELSKERVRTVFGNTLPFDREQTLNEFKTGKLKYLANVDVLTTGFDAPRIDCVAILRPTMSAGLLVQMCGRGFRLHPDKSDCLILDFGGNILRHGPIDQIKSDGVQAGKGPAPAKECPNCNALIACGYAVCPECGHEFPPRENVAHDSQATAAGILSGQSTDEEFEVLETSYRVHVKRDATPEDPMTMRVDYRVGLNQWHSEWVCFEHEGYALQKAAAWWRKRTLDPFPESTQDAVNIATNGGLVKTHAITVRSTAGERFEKVIKHVLDPLPEETPEYVYAEDSLPF